MSDYNSTNVYGSSITIFDTVDDLKKECDHLRDRLLNSKQNEKDSLLRCGKLEESIEQDRHATSELNEQFQTLEQEKHSMERTEAQLEREHHRELDQATQDYQDALDAKQKEMDSMAKISVREFETLQRDHQRHIEKAQADKDRLEKLQAKFEADLAQNIKNLSSAKNQFEDLSVNLDDFEIELDQSRSDRDEKISRATEELVMQNQELTADLELIEDELKKLKESVREQEQLCKQAEKKLAVEQEAKDALKEERKMLESVLGKIQGSAVKFDDEFNTSKREYTSILVCDDEPDIRELVAEELSDHFKVYTAVDGENGLEVLKAHPEISVICTDQKMPKLVGIEFGAAAQEIDEHLYVILVTAFSDFDVCKNAMNRGAIHTYLNKPVNFDELNEAIHVGFEHYEKHLQSSNLVENAQNMVVEKIEMISETLQHLEVSNHKLTIENDSLQEITSTQQHIVDEVTGRLDKVVTTHTALSSEADTLLSKTTECERRTQEMTESQGNMSSALQETTQELEKLNIEFADTAATIEKYEAEVKELAETEDKLTAEHTQLEKDVASNKQAVENSQKTLKTLATQSESVITAHAALEAKAQAACATRDVGAVEVNQLNDVYASVSSEIAAIEAKFAHMQRVFDGSDGNDSGDTRSDDGGVLQAKIDAMSAQNQTQTETIAQLKASLLDVWARNKELETQEAS
jgi:YesN/AraC family two-component response regulator